MAAPFVSLMFIAAAAVAAIVDAWLSTHSPNPALPRKTPMKFSELVSTVSTADTTKAAAAKALADATTAAGSAHGAVVAALHVKPKIALGQPDGSVDVYTLNSDATDFVVEVIPGDFDIETPAPSPIG